MMSTLEYMLLMMMTAQPDPSAVSMSKIEPSSGDPLTRETLVVQSNGRIEMQTILMEPRDMMAERLEAPIRITPDLVPLFKIGAPLTVMVEGTSSGYPAKIARIESITDATGLSVQVIAELDKKTEELKPGMIATAVMSASP